jgi:hypothetical protein
MTVGHGRWQLTSGLDVAYPTVRAPLRRSAPVGQPDGGGGLSE